MKNIFKFLIVAAFMTMTTQSNSMLRLFTHRSQSKALPTIASRIVLRPMITRSIAAPSMKPSSQMIRTLGSSSNNSNSVHSFPDSGTIEAFKAVMNTQNASHPLNPNDSELIETFNSIQKIREFAAQVYKEQNIKKDRSSKLIATMYPWLKSGVETWPGPNPFLYQTKRGLYLTVESYKSESYWPGSLYTPWGSVGLFGHVFSKSENFEKFRKNLKLEFVKNYGEGWNQFFSKDHTIHFYKDSFNNQIKEEDLNKYRGTDIKILSDGGYTCDSLYKIVSLNGKELPEVQDIPKHEYRNYEAVETNWAEMMKKYKKKKLS